MHFPIGLTSYAAIENFRKRPEPAVHFFNSSMNSDAQNLLGESREWLGTQESPSYQSQKWYALVNFKSFLDRIESEPSELGIAAAVYALRHHISDQFDWSADYCKDISAFCERADRIRRQYKSDR